MDSEKWAQRDRLDITLFWAMTQLLDQIAPGWEVEKNLNVQDLLMLKTSMITEENRRA